MGDFLSSFGRTRGLSEEEDDDFSFLFNSLYLAGVFSGMSREVSEEEDDELDDTFLSMRAYLLGFFLFLGSSTELSEEELGFFFPKRAKLLGGFNSTSTRLSSEEELVFFLSSSWYLVSFGHTFNSERLHLAGVLLVGISRELSDDEDEDLTKRPKVAGCLTGALGTSMELSSDSSVVVSVSSEDDSFFTFGVEMARGLVSSTSTSFVYIRDELGEFEQECETHDEELDAEEDKEPGGDEEESPFRVLAEHLGEEGQDVEH